MQPLEGSKLLASMDFFVRERVLRVIEHDQHSPTKATLLRDGMAQLTKPERHRQTSEMPEASGGVDGDHLN